MNNANSVKTKGWVKVLLAGSLALNLAVLGLGAGAWLRHDGAGPQTRRDFGMGPLAAAMTGHDWREMRPAFLTQNPDLKRGYDQLRAEYEPIITALKAETFDKTAFETALEGISRANHARIESSSRILGDYIANMNPEARKGYSKRLQKVLDHAHQAQKHRKKKDEYGRDPVKE